MSLVGSLEDLGLGDILQIITLSRKSGALLLRSDSGEGRVIFRDGLVCGARVKDKTPDLRELLVEGGAMAEGDFDAARAEASKGKVDLSAALAERLAPERFEGLRRECVEGAVLTMFGWESGEFSFEVGEDSPADEYEVMLDAGINAQYLAMEGTRRTDEDGREPEVSPDDPASFADLAEEMDEEDTTAIAEAGSTTEDEVEEALEAAIAATPIVEAETLDGDQTARFEVAAGEDTMVLEPVPLAQPAAASPARMDPGQRPPVVIVADELPLLEWVKRTLEGTFRRVHIFQKADLAVQRLRQYVSRGDAALVLVSPTLGVEKVDRLVARMKKQSPRSSVLWLGEVDSAGSADGVVPCASSYEAASPSGPAPKIESALLDAVVVATGGGAGGSDRAATPSDPRLDEVLSRLGDPDTRGEVLNVVLEFAAEQFTRVALLAVRDGQALGLAGLGLDACGGPDDDGLQDVRIAVERSTWLSSVVETGRPVQAAPEGTGDHELAARLGDHLPEEAWLSPVISGGQVVAILYADNGPSGDPMGDTAALETVLAKAGEVLEQAMEERARQAH